MKNTKMVVTMGLMGLLILVGLASSQQAGDLPQGVTPVNSCRNVTWEDKVDQWGVCTRPYQQRVCYDEPTNASCETLSKQHEWPCVVNTTIQTFSKLECTTQAFEIEDQVRVNTARYACAASKEGTTTILICDSKYDGNGDTKCTSGESCMKFVIDGKSVQQFERNSQDTFVEVDDSFVQARATAEVLQ